MAASVFISGASTGIGLSLTHQLDAMGWRIFAAALPDDRISQLTGSTSERVVTLPMDITDAKAIQEAVTRIQNEVATSGLKAIVNNAGIQIPGALEALSIQQIREQFEVNVFGHLQVTQAMLPLLRQAQNARIVNVSSLMGTVAMPLLAAYSMSKHALEAMTDVLRLELAADGIHVISIQPGAIQTPMSGQMQALLDKERQSMPENLQARYANLFENMAEALHTQYEKAAPPQTVVDAIVHALTSDKPKTRYAIGAPVKALIALRALAPDSVVDAILKRALKLNS